MAQPTTDTPSASGPGPQKTSTPPSAELSEPQLLSELIAAREQLKIAIEAHASERTAWETTGAELKGRRNENVAEARMRAELQTELNGARAQLRQAIDAHNAELRACLEELKTAAEERTALEAALDTAQAKQRDTADTYKSDRATWETTRDELKASLKRTSAELRQTMDAHASERATWADTLQQLNAAQTAPGRISQRRRGTSGGAGCPRQGTAGSARRPSRARRRVEGEAGGTTEDGRCA